MKKNIISSNKNLESCEKGFIFSIRRYFKFDSHKAIFRKEIVGGISTFLAMCYILAVNPSIVGDAPIDPSLGNVVGNMASKYQGGLFLATAISAVIGTFFMGVWARIPVAVAPGMGLNAFFAYNVAKSVGFESAMTVTIISGILYLILVMTPARNKIAKMLPHNFKIAVGAAIGFFIAYLGLQSSGIIVQSKAPGLVSAIGNFGDPLVITAVCLIVLGLILHFGKVPGGILLTMVIGAIIIIALSLSGVVNEGVANYGLLGSYSDFSTFTDVAKAGWIGFSNIEMWKSPMTYIGVLSFLYMDFFDTTGSLISINKMADLDKVDKNWMTKANQVDAASTIFGAGIGATTVTTFVESTVGIGHGARTGFSTLVIASLFALSIPAWPIIQVFMPIEGLQPITSPILIIIGAMMISQLRFFEWEIFIDIPMMFVTIIMMLLSNSIAHGLSFGMILFVILNSWLGLIQKITHKKKVINDFTIPTSGELKGNVKVREFNYLKRVNIVCWIIALISLVYIVLEMGQTYGNWF